ncbi:MAG: hypothetical protein ABRQ23_00175 [Syntrophomonadaceae bacterium]
MRRKKIATLLILVSVLFTMVVGCGGSTSTSSTAPMQPLIQQPQQPSSTPTNTDKTVVQPTSTPTNTNKTVAPPTQPVAKPVTPTVTPPVQTNTQTQTVYTTNTGSKYHSAGCQYLSKSCIPISLSDAKARGLTPCSKCSPPR